MQHCFNQQFGPAKETIGLEIKFFNYLVPVRPEETGICMDPPVDQNAVN